MKRKLFITIIALSVTGLVGSFAFDYSNRPEATPHTNSIGNTHELTVYKSPDCGCCAIHADYLERAGYKIERVLVDDPNEIKEQYGVPTDLWSCHTTIVNGGEYFIEGHIPEEAFAKILEEEPAISGIGMPGMPSGSPGMPGPQLEPFSIKQVSTSGRISEYMQL